MSKRHFSPHITAIVTKHIAFALWRVFLVVSYFALTTTFVSSCSPQASVEWENKQRTAMTEKLSSTFNDTSLANSYKVLTAQLTEIERENLNTLLRIILDRNPSKADKNTTVIAALNAVTSIRGADSIRSKLPEALTLLIEIAEGTDASLSRIAEGASSASVDVRLEYLNRTRNMVNAAKMNEPFKNLMEESVPKIPAENMPTSVLFWDVIKDDSRRENLLTRFWSIASFASPSDFELLVSKNAAQTARESYYSALGKIKIDDPNAGLFLKFINLVSLESLATVGSLVGEYTNSQTAANVRGAILEVVRKSLALRSSIADSLAISANNFLGKTDAFVRLNGIASSIDAMRGEGFHTGVSFLNKFISDQETLVCALQGESTEKVKFSFKWNKNESLLIDWTTPGFERKHTSQTFALGERPQCFARVYIDDAQVLEIEGEIVTIGSSPPEFESGRVPADGAETVAQGGVLSYTAENAIDANPGDSVIYRITAQAAQGSVMQTGLNQFEYRPIVSFFGQDQFRYQACDQTGICSAEKKVIVTVTQANQPPQIFGVAGSAVNDATKTIVLSEDVTDPASVPVNYLIAADDDTEPAMCTSVLQITSLDETKLLNTAGKIEISGTFPQCSFKLYPVLNAFGSFKIKAKLTDPENAFTEKEFDVFITNINDAPTISSIADTSTNEDTPKVIDNIAVADVDSSLTCTGSMSVVSSSNATLLPTGNVTFANDTVNTGKCKITLSPAAEQHGSSTVVVQVSDGTLSSNRSFVLTVNPVNDAPVLPPLSNLTINEDTVSHPVTFNVTDVDHSIVCSSAVTASSDNSTLLPSGALVVSGSSSSCTLAITPAANKHGSATITVNVTDGVIGGTDSKSFTLTVSPVNDVPTISVDSTNSTIEDTSVEFNLTVADLDGDLVCNATHLSMSSSATAVVNTGVVFSGTWPACKATVSPVADANGTTTLTFTVRDNVAGATTNSATSLLTVSAFDDAPTISTVTAQTTTEDTSLTGVAVTIFDKDSAITCTNLTVTSSNTALVPSNPTGISIGGAAQSCTLGFAPTLNQSGSTTIIMSLPYSPTPVIENFTLSVTAANDAPTLDAISAQSTNEDTALNGIELTVADIDSTLVCGTALSVTTSTNSTLLPTAAVTFSNGGSAGKCNMNIAPAANKNGSSDITVRLSDGTLHAERTFTLNVNAVNDAPTLSSIADTSTNEDTPKVIDIAIADVDASLKCTDAMSVVSSNDVTLLPIGNVTFADDTGMCKITLSPAANGYGSSTVVVQVSDGTLSSNRSFVLTVNPVNDAPVLPPLSNLTINEDTVSHPVTFNVTDVDHSIVCSSAVTASSDNSTLLPSGALVVSGSSSSCTLAITPAANKHGSATITVNVTDGVIGGTDSKSFTLTVSPVNDVPTISVDSTNSTIEDTSVEFNLTVADLDGDLVCNATHLSMSSSATAVVNTGVVFSGTWPACKATVSPVADANGTTTLTFTVRDNVAGATTNSATSLLTVSAFDDAPTISTVTAQTTTEDTSLTGVAVTIFDKDSAITCTNLTVTSSNTALVPSNPTGISIGGAAQSCTLGFAPTLNQSGSTTIIMSLPYSPTPVIENFTLSVTAANDAPTLDAISAQSTNEDSALNGVELTVADIDSTLVCSSALSATTSTNATLIPTSAIIFSSGSSAGKCNMNIAPAANKNGSSDITVRLSDGALHAERTFTLTVNAVSDQPTINAISSQVTIEDTPLSVSFTINDVDGDLTCTSTHLLALSTDSNKVNTISGGVAFSGTYPNCIATIDPVDDAYGIISLAILVQDGIDANALSSLRMFQLSITAVNDAPTITSPGNQTTNEDTTKTINITMYDVDNTLTCPIPSASMTVASQDTTLLPSGNIAQSLSGSSGGHVTCSVSLTPATNLSGTVALNISATDGQYTDTKSFNLTIDGVNDAPTISAISAQSTPEDQAKSISFTIADVDGALTCDTNRLSYTSGNSARVATTGAVTWSGTSGSCAANVTPVANATGTVSITFTVNDGANGGSGSLSAASTFDLTIDPANDAPTITLGTLPSVSEDQASAPVVPFTLADIDSNLSCNSTYLSYQSLDTNKIAASSAVSFGGAWPDCTATVTLLANANGSSSFKINVNDNANGGTGGAMSAEATVNLNVTAVNDAPTGTVVCDTLGSGNMFRTAAATGGAWSLASCSGASDVDGDQLTYQLDLIETGAQCSGSYPCPATIASSAGGTAISGNFPSGAGVYGSCRYRLKACDGLSQCTAQSTNSVIISSFQLAVGTPTTPTLSSSCVVESSGSITASANLTSVTWSGHTSAPGASASTGTISSYPGTATFNTDITSQLLTSTFLPSTPTKSTQLAAANSTLVITQGTLDGASASPPSAQITSSTSSSSNYTITRVLESLAVRQGGTSGAATTFDAIHADGLQADYVTTASVCRTCTSAPTVSISAGNAHNCVVVSGSITRCWGDNSDGGRLGVGSGALSFNLPTLVPNTNLAGFTHTQIAAGSNFSCLLGTAANGVRCWGKNNSLQLGRGSTNPPTSTSPPAASVSGLTNPIAVAASKTGEHACAINTSGNVLCWGKGTDGQLGNAADLDSHTAVEVKLVGGTTSLPLVRSIAAGGSHTCAALSFDSNYTAGIYCWGENDKGQLGDNTIVKKNTATAVSTTNQGLTSETVWFTQLVAGASHSCALRNGGEVFCWGLNSKGQLGTGNTTDSSIPVQVKADTTTNLTNVVGISAGTNHTCALKNDHTVLCWGANGSGQLGDGYTIDSSYPVTALISANSNAVAISAGGSHTCVVSINGTVQCWGAGNSGQLGTNTFDSSGDGVSDDCDPAPGQTSYCEKSPVLVQWTAGNTANSSLRPKTCNKYSIP